MIGNGCVLPCPPGYYIVARDVKCDSSFTPHICPSCWREIGCLAHDCHINDPYSMLTGCCQPLPTPAPINRCDEACGTCGVRLGDGSCVADWGNVKYRLKCCHMDCVNNACKYVLGGGIWNCKACL